MGFRPRLAIGERARDDIVNVARQRRCRRHAAQSRFRLSAPLGFERAPGAECAHQPSGDLRILRIEFEHDIGDEIVARAVERG